jgi:hypothetical protein
MILRLAAVLLAAALSLPAGIIFHEDFEGGVAIQSQTSGVLEGTQFRVVSGSVDIVTPYAQYAVNCTYPTSGTCIDTTGGGEDGLGTIETIDEIELAAGEYILSFDLIGWRYYSNTQRATVRVTLGDLFDQVFERDGALNPYETIIVPLVVESDTSARLVFSTLQGRKFAGAILDNIIIRSVDDVSDVHSPEPGTWALIGLGGALLFIRKRLTARQTK